MNNPNQRGGGRQLGWVAAVVVSLALLTGPGCGDGGSKPAPAGDHGHAHGHGHHHEPPHGGTLVELGTEEHNIEFMMPDADGKAVAYIYDGHVENFVRIGLPLFEVEVQGRPEVLSYHAVTNTATGEKVGSTAMFEARADWLKGSTGYVGRLRSIEVRGKTYTNIPVTVSGGEKRK